MRVVARLVNRNSLACSLLADKHKPMWQTQINSKYKISMTNTRLQWGKSYWVYFPETEPTDQLRLMKV